MKSGTKVLGVLTALAIMLAGVATLSYDNTNVEAETVFQVTPGSGGTYNFTCNVGEPFKINNVTKNSDFSGTIVPGMTFTQVNMFNGVPIGYISGTATNAGTYTFSWTGPSPYTVNLTVVGTIPYNAPTNLTPITGANWYYTPTAMDGVTIGIEGAPWLSTAGNAVYGTPATPGDYTVTITLSKAGYTTSTHTFTLSVASQLVPTNSPTNGIIIYAV
jgi:hypothetical protein